MIINVKSAKKCAFCKYWYDPTDSAITPKSPKLNMWDFDEHCKKKCLKTNLDMYAFASCGKYECKIPLQ